MSLLSSHRRLAAAITVGIGLTLVPVVALSASASPSGPSPQPIVTTPGPEAPAAPTALRIDTTKAFELGKVKIAWNASPTADVQYQVLYFYEDFDSDVAYPSATSFTVPDVGPGESVDIVVRALRNEQLSDSITLRVTGLDNVAPNYNFTDTTANTFRYEISWLSTAGITTGYSGTNGSRFFSPSAPVLREQMAAFLYRYAQNLEEFSYTAPAQSPFTDVPTNATFYKEIAWLNSVGISTGYAGPNGTKTFRPSQPVLREQMAAFLYRFDGTSFEAEGGSFTDVPASATFFDEIEWLANEGISTGYVGPNGTKTFRGSDAVLREQMAAFLYRYETGPFGQNIG